LIRNEIGYPIGSFFGYQIIGLFQNADDVAKSPSQTDAAPGRFKYADVNGWDSVNKQQTGKPDGRIDDNDRLHFGSPHPDFTLGLNIGFKYKNFDFTAFFYGSFGNKILNSQKLRTDLFSTGAPPAAPKSTNAYYNSWTPDRPNTQVPKTEFLPNFSSSAVVNSYQMESGTYVKSKTITLGYTFPKKWLDRVRVERFRIYFQVANLFTITDYSGLDPEVSGLYGPNSGGYITGYGIDFGVYPDNEKKWLAGISLTF